VTKVIIRFIISVRLGSTPLAGAKLVSDYLSAARKYHNARKVFVPSRKALRPDVADVSRSGSATVPGGAVSIGIGLEADLRYNPPPAQANGTSLALSRLPHLAACCGDPTRGAHPGSHRA